jgi:hypothetical protein
MTTVKAILLGTTKDDLIFPVTISNDTNLLITQSNIIPSNGSFMLDSPNGNLMQAESVPKAIASPDGYKGWYYKNSDGKGTPNLKMNWYFYDGTSHGYTVADVREITATISLRHPLNKPFFVLYTKTGSSRTYTTNELLIEGEKVLFYFAETGYIPQNNDNLRLVRLTLNHDDGLVLPEMPVQFLSIHSNSSDPDGEFEMVVENLGFRIINITCVYDMLTPSSGGGGTSSNVNIISTVSTPITNDSLNKLSFYDSGTSGYYLKTLAQELTNVHIMGQENYIECDIVNTNPIKVIQINDSVVKTYTLADFTDGRSPSVNIVKSNIQAVFGVASITGMTLGVSLGIEYSADNANWYNSQTSLYMNNGVSFGASYQLGAPYIRLVLGGTVDSITVNLCLK